jgi:hypothetical protein
VREKQPLTLTPFDLDLDDGDIVIPYSASRSLSVKELPELFI